MAGRLDPDLKSFIREARRTILANAYAHITSAIELHKKSLHPPACFLAMTAIEEAGKLQPLWILQGDLPILELASIDLEEEELEADFGAEDLREAVSDLFQNHKNKALVAVTFATATNIGPVRRHGKYQEENINIVSGLPLVANTGNQWMNIRNSCLYTDINFSAKNVNSPSSSINEHYSYFFICMALEVIAESAEAGLGSYLESLPGNSNVEEEAAAMLSEMDEPVPATKFFYSSISTLKSFMSDYATDFCPTELAFFSSPQFEQQRNELRENEVQMDEELMDRARRIVREDEGLDESDERYQVRADQVYDSLVIKSIYGTSNCTDDG